MKTNILNSRFPEYLLLFALLLFLTLLTIFNANSQTINGTVNEKGIHEIKVSQIDSIRNQFHEFDRSPEILGLIDYFQSGTRISVNDYGSADDYLKRQLISSGVQFTEGTETVECGTTVLYGAKKFDDFTRQYMKTPLFEGERFYTVYVDYLGGSINSGTNSQINSSIRKECSFNICNHELGHGYLTLSLLNRNVAWTVFYRQLNESFADMMGVLTESYADNPNLEKPFNRIAPTNGRTYRTIRWRHYKRQSGYHNMSITQSFVFHSLIFGAKGTGYFDGKTYEYDIKSVGKKEGVKLFENVALRYGRDVNGWQPLNVFDWKKVVIEEAEKLFGNDWRYEQVINALYSVGLEDTKFCPLNTAILSGYKAIKYEAQNEVRIMDKSIVGVGAEFIVKECK